MARNLFCLFIFMFIVECSFAYSDQSKYSMEAFTCRLLKAKSVESQPWLEYPLIFEPVVRGRLIIWSGVSTLPGSEPECIPSSVNDTKKVTLKFTNFADKFEWTFFDKSQGLTHHGITVNSRENVVFELAIDNKQSNSYLDCNSIEMAHLTQEPFEHQYRLRTMCHECGQANIALVNDLIGELISSKFNYEITENLIWHLTQLIGSQRFTGPVSL